MDHADGYPKFNVRTKAKHGPTAWAFTFDFPAVDRTHGVILPIKHRNWISRRELWLTGGPTGFCSAVVYASIILHEFIHIVGDIRCAEVKTAGINDYRRPCGTDSRGNIKPSGTLNTDYVSPWLWENAAGTMHEGDDAECPCWDEARMAAIIFKWASLQRHPCLAKGSECGRYADLRRFAHSQSGI
ncbi:MAG: hypothetical protein GY913_07350 [Proteobacteria bacterium]|nr:hypothetical protein [Pseudomonadota bacterium]MCP4916725.1 hypothetical protein [Pseudomonadota bacterium]